MNKLINISFNIKIVTSTGFIANNAPTVIIFDLEGSSMHEVFKEFREYIESKVLNDLRELELSSFQEYLINASFVVIDVEDGAYKNKLYEINALNLKGVKSNFSNRRRGYQLLKEDLKMTAYPEWRELFQRKGVRLEHIPTGKEVVVDESLSTEENFSIAFGRLQEELNSISVH